MRTFSYPSIQVSTDSCLESTGNKRLILQRVFLAPTISLDMSSKIISKSTTNTSLRLSLSLAAKTRVITVAVPSLVLGLVASAKALSKATGNVSVTTPPDPGLHLQMSAKTISRAQVQLVLYSIGVRINSASTRLITESYSAILVTR